MTTPPSPHCPDCGEPLPADSPQALCPACLMRQALASRTILDGETNAPAAPPPSPEEIADKFPQFEILECLGRGGMGVVYKARQKSLNRLVAIKILAPERVHEARFAGRFAREAELLAKLNHPHIVTIHDFGETGGLFYLVMEFVDGVNLRDLLRDGRLEPEQALAIVPPICDALQYAHDKGVVHRDIKPENLLLDRDGRIKIADFGIASLVGAEDGSAGTPPYMAPEQSGSSTAIDHRTDIYALGVVLYEMLTGERPQKDLVAPSKKVQIDVRLDEMVMRALEKSPELRYQTAGEFRTVVEALQTPAPPPVAMPPSSPEAAKQPGAFRRFWWLFLVMIPVGVLFGLGLGALWLYLAPKKYEAQTIVMIVPAPGSTIEGSPHATWMEEVKSEPTLQQVSQRLNLARSWQAPESEVVSRLRKTVTTQQIRGANLISIKVRNSEGRESAEIANAMVHVLQARSAELPTANERIIVHEEARAPGHPVSPNPPLVLAISAAAGLLLSPLAALLLIAFLGRRSSRTSPGLKVRRRWIVAACVAGIVLLVAGKQRLFPTSVIPPTNEAPVIGHVEFVFQHPRSIDGMGPVKSMAFPVKNQGEPDWMPQSGMGIPLRDGSTLLVKARVRVSREGTHATAFVSTSTNGRDWQPESVAIGLGQGTTTLGLNDGLQTTIRWLPGATPPAAARPMWFIAAAGVVVLLLIVAGLIVIVRLFKSQSGTTKGLGIGCLVLLLLGVLLLAIPVVAWLYLPLQADQPPRQPAENFGRTSQHTVPAGAESPIRLRATLRLIDLPAELDHSLLDQPATLLADPRVRVLAVLRSVIEDGEEGTIQVPWVMGREIRGPASVPREGILFVRPELQLEDGQVSYELAAQEAETEAKPERKSLGRRQVRIGEQDILEEHAKPFSRKQLAVLSFEPAAPDAGSGNLGPATGGYTFGPVMDRVIHDPDKASGDCLIDFDTGNLAGIPDDPDLKARLKNQFRDTMDQEIRPSPTGKGMDAMARITDSPLQGGLVGVHLIAAKNSWWKSRDAGRLIGFINASDLAPASQSKFVEMIANGDDITNELGWRFCTDEGLIGLMIVTGFTDDRSGVKIRYKLVQPPSIGWDPAPGTLHVPPDVTEEAPLPGGRSPDGKYEVRVHGMPDDMPWSYVIRVHATGKAEPIAVLDDIGGYMRYRTAKEECTALWHPSGKFVVVSDRGTKRTREMYLLHVSDQGAERLPLPDYVLNAFGRVDATERNRFVTSTPERWDGDDLHLKLRFDTAKGQYACDVVLRVSHGEHTAPRVSLASCSDPVITADGN